jgi:ABC-2 type transport system permease protein
LLAGKGLAIMAVIGALLLPAGLLGGIALGFSSNHHVIMENLLGRGVWLILGYTLYLTGFTALALGVSAAGSSSRKVLIVLLAFWVMNSFVVPRVMTDLARRVIPTPTAVEFKKGLVEARKASFGHDDTHPAFVAFRDRLLKQYAVTRVEDMPVSFRGLSLRHDDESGYRIFDKHYGVLFDAYARQERTRAMAGVAFPLAALQLFSMGIAGTDTAHHNNFAIAAEAYRREIQNKMSEDLIRNHKNSDKNYIANRALWETIRPFDYQIPPMKWALANQLWNLAILLLWTFAVTVFAVVATKRLRPTI